MDHALNFRADNPRSVPESRLLPYAQDRRRSRSRWGRIAAWTALVTSAFFNGLFFAFFPPVFLPALLVPLIVLTLLVIWALPSDRAAPVRSMKFLFWGFFVSLILWPNYLAVALPGLPWITLLRLFGIPLAFILLISVSISDRFRSRIKEVILQTPLVWKYLAGFAFVQALSVPFSRHMADSASKVVIDQVYWTSIFFVSCVVFSKPRNVVRWVYVLSFISFPVCLIALWEWHLGHVPWAGHIPSFLRIEDDSVQRILAGGRRAATGIYRVQSTFSTSLGLAEFLALTTPFVIHIIMTQKRLLIKGFAILQLAFTFFTLMNTDARLGAIGFFLSILMSSGLWGARLWKRHKRSIFAPAAILSYPLMVSLFFAATFLSGRLHRMVWGGGETQFSTDSRLDQLHRALPLMIRRPFGYGAGQGADVLGFTNPGGTLTIDSYYLTIGLEYGFIGMFFYFGMFIAGGVYGLRAMFASNEGDRDILIPLITSIAVFVVIKSVFSQQDSHPLVFMILGMIAGFLASSPAKRMGSLSN